MRQRSNLIILFGIAFFIVGGAIAYLVLNDDDGGGSSTSGKGDVAEVTVLVASDDIAPNTLGSDVIEQGLIETKQVSTATKPPDAVPSASGLDNQIFAVGVSKGDVITTAQLTTRSLSNVQIPEGYDGLAVTVEYTPGGAGYIAPGDTVNVYGVYGVPGSVSDGGLTTSSDGGPIAIPRSELALTNVLVLGVSDQQPTAAQTAANADDTAATGARAESNRPLTYLLALRPTDVERVVQLTSFAQIYLSLTADDAPNVGDTPGVGGDTVNGPVSAASAAPQS